MSTFEEDRRISEDVETQAWLDGVYREYFGDVSAISRTRSAKSKTQENGVDVVLHLDRSKTIYIDEKIRSREYGRDVLLELWSNAERRTRGWLVKDLTADFIANAYPASRRCEILPVLPLRRAWKRHGREWYAKAVANSDGFAIRNGKTLSGGRVLYETVNIIVPRAELLAAIGMAARVIEGEPDPVVLDAADASIDGASRVRPGHWFADDWAEILEWSKRLDQEFDAANGAA